MKIDITSMFFNSKIEGQTATPAWGTSIGQNKSRDCRIDDFKEEVVDMVIGMTYKSISDFDNLDVSKGSSDREIVTCSVFQDVFLNNKKIENCQYVLLLVREHSKSHEGRLLISYAPYITYNGVSNQECINLMQKTLGCNPQGCWFVYDISIKNQSELHFYAVVVNSTSPMIYSSIKSRNRSEEWKSLIPDGNAGKEEYQTPTSLQMIFYGAPGTGKSHTILERTEHEDVIRTTFHPDTDYSTFVGAYKPTTIDAPVMTVIGTKAVPVENEDGSPRIEPKIIYEFVNQAFLQAYVKAWEKYCEGGFDNAQKQFLVIEEINRGNCAQIFGDLFQLLDRNNAGFSDYPIKADADMAKQLKKQLKDLTIEDPDAINSLYKGENIVCQVLDGELLLLPKNLYIWATMNTSDQSLFPIDSAFKRRWDWQYMPIANGLENWYISVDEYKFDWWKFLQKINKLIGATTNSEDKKLGYYFCKAKNKEIDANLFVSKVIFYLWNDVFKDYEFANSVFDDIDGKKLTFDKFYTTINGNTIVVEDKVVMFLNKLDEAIDKEYSMLLPNIETATGLSGNDFTNYSFEGSAPMGKSELGKTIMLKYLNENAGLTFDEIKAKFPDSLLGSVANKGLIVEDEEDLGSYQRYYVGGFTSADGVKFKIYKQWTVGNIQNIKNFAFSQGWSVEEKGSWRRKDNNA